MHKTKLTFYIWFLDLGKFWASLPMFTAPMYTSLVNPVNTTGLTYDLYGLQCGQGILSNFCTKFHAPSVAHICLPYYVHELTFMHITMAQPMIFGP